MLGMDFDYGLSTQGRGNRTLVPGDATAPIGDVQKPGEDGQLCFDLVFSSEHPVYAGQVVSAWGYCLWITTWAILLLQVGLLPQIAHLLKVSFVLQALCRIETYLIINFGVNNTPSVQSVV